MTIFILGLNHLQYLVCLKANQISELQSASNLWEGSIEIPYGHWLVWAFFARYCAKFQISWKRSWCRDVIKCLVHFVTKVFPFNTYWKTSLALLFEDRYAFIKCMTYSRLLNILWVSPPCASRNGVKRRQLWQFFSVDDPNTISIEPSSACQRNTI